MPIPPSRAERLVAMFDSYCKTVLRNASRNIKRTQINRKKHEAVENEQIQYLFDQQGSEDTYPFFDLTIHADKFSCVVFNETLHKALLSLPDQQRTVLMLDFWYGWSDEKIAKHMKVTSRTVYNLRQRAFKAIRSFF
ncbi:MAG: RNA polymerase sigma factor [Agathobaculum sp.]|jgi:RNA polymerase sigma factor (sigma-70 family)|uniref:RNA polymerase sigma factor n=1 Tax=Agathobaculum sp. TaxID=2048138 RepID=UPI003D8F5057